MEFSEEELDASWQAIGQHIRKQKRKTRIRAVSVIVVLILGLPMGFQAWKMSQWKELGTERLPMDLVLADGSEVTLNSFSKILYKPDVWSASNERRLLLQGEAFFKVRHQDSVPFIVQTDNAEVTVLGTSFNVRADAESSAVYVKTGKVKLGAKNQAVLLTSKELGKWDAGTGRLSKTPQQSENALAWKTKTLFFDNSPFSEVAHNLEKLSGKSVEYPSVFESCRITATLTFTDLGNLLQVLELTLGAKIVVDESTLRLEGHGC